MTQQEQEAKQHLLCHFSAFYHYYISPFLKWEIELEGRLSDFCEGHSIYE